MRLTRERFGLAALARVAAVVHHTHGVPDHVHEPHLQQLPVAPNVGLLQAGCQQHVEQDARRQEQKVLQRQRPQSQDGSQRAERDAGEQRDARHGEQHHRRGCAALDERELRGPKHMDDQRLAPHGLDEPSGLEQCDVGKLHLLQLGTRVDARQVIEQHAVAHEDRAEHEVHEDVGHEVEDGAGGADPQHELAHAGGVPLAGHADELLVHVIPWDGQAAAVVDEVQQEQMDAHHGQERQQGGRCQDTEHVSEVGARGHLDVLDHVRVGLSTIDDALLQDHEILL